MKAEQERLIGTCCWQIQQNRARAVVTEHQGSSQRLHGSPHLVGVCVILTCQVDRPEREGTEAHQGISRRLGGGAPQGLLCSLR